MAQGETDDWLPWGRWTDGIVEEATWERATEEVGGDPTIGTAVMRELGGPYPPLCCHPVNLDYVRTVVKLQWGWVQGLNLHQGPLQSARSEGEDQGRMWGRRLLKGKQFPDSLRLLPPRLIPH